MGGWVTAWDVEYYNGRAKDIYGQPLERGPWYNYQDGDFTRVAIDRPIRRGTNPRRSISGAICS